MWKALAELRDGLGPYEEERLLRTVQAIAAGQLPFSHYRRIVSALAESKRAADAADELTWQSKGKFRSPPDETW
jgi:hypothetical protein